MYYIEIAICGREIMIRLLLALCVVCLAGGYAGAQKVVTLRGCSYDGLEGCRDFKATNGHVYTLATEPGVQMPPPNLIITVTGTIKPKQIGFCAPKEILTASKIAATKQSCRHR
jgi:hypothetical protein